MEQEWVEGLHRRMAAAIKSARAGRSAQWLADETERLGYPISRAAIANYESGRKKGLDVAELLVLAAALRIPPLTILFPELPDGLVEVLPDLQTTSWDAAAWFAGEASSPDPKHQPWPASREYELVRTVRERRSQLLAMAQFFGLIHRFARTAEGEESNGSSWPPELMAYTEQIKNLEQEVARLERMIRESGGVIDGK
jgi:transcriptional regulator with XRE-family HTH domain